MNEIVVGNGAKQLIFNAILATVSAGDEVIVPVPYWVSYPDIISPGNGTADLFCADHALMAEGVAPFYSSNSH